MRFSLGLMGLFLLPGSIIAAWHGIILIAAMKVIWFPLLIGMILGIPFSKLLIKYIPIISTFEHELTHSIIALLFFRKISGFKATSENGGYVNITSGFGGKIGDVAISLAPYYLPTFTLFFTLISPLISRSFGSYFNAIIGLSFVYHSYSTYRETSRIQTDIKENGNLFSGIFISFMTIAVHGFICYFLTKGLKGLIIWSNLVWNESLSFYLYFYNKINMILEI